MKPVFTKYQKTIDHLPLAARSAILAALLSIIFVIWYSMFWQDLSQSLAITKNKVKDLKISIPLLEKQEKILAKEIKFGLVLNKTDSTGAPPSSEVKTMLYALSTTTPNVVLMQIKNAPPKEVALESSSNIKPIENSLVIKFQGNYFATMNYLHSIEKLPWKIFWDKFEYKVIQYPLAEITLYLHTITYQGM